MLDNVFRFAVSGVIVLFLLCLWLACVPRSEEDKIRVVSRSIAPEGHLTKTHLYVHWPAVYTKARYRDPGGKEIVKALTLKIPIEYLGQNLITFDNAAKIERHEPGKHEPAPSAIDYFSRINEALSIHDHQITMIYLRLQPGAKPDVLMLPYKSDPPDVARKKLENFQNSYAVHIQRNTHFVIPLSDRTVSVPDISVTQSSYERPPSLSCIGTTCYANFSVKGRLAKISGEGESLENFYKAKAARSSQQPLKPAAQPLPAGLPKWHEKVDPTQALLNSFVLPEDSPEIKGMFYSQ